MRQIFVEEITVFVFFDARIKERGAMPQAEVTNPLLDEVEVLVAILVLLLQCGHVVRLKAKNKTVVL